MRSNIIKKGTVDEVRCAVTELRLSETFMDVPQLSVKVVSSTPITFEIGDYITYDYNGVTYTLRSIPEAAKNARPSTYGEAFVYNLVFYSPMWDLRNVPFLDLVLYDNGQHFTSMPDVTTYEDVYGIAARVQANMDNMYPGKWEIRVVSGLSADSTLAKRLSETQDFSLSDGKCLDALSQVYSQWGVSFMYSYEGGKHVITIGGAEMQEDTTGLFMYGRGNGLKVIKSSVQNASEIATRYYVYGGTQNMQPRYYNGRIMEPEYIHASDASNPIVTAICSGRRLLGDNMYVPNLMIPVSKWGRSTWYVWTASSHSQAVFTEVRNPSAGDDFAFDEPNIGSSRNVISSVSSGGIVVNGFTYQYLTEVLYPDIRKAYIDAPQSYLDKYGIRPATLRFDGSGEREDIHPSIKGLTVGDIRAGLGSGAEYYPSASVYTDPDERIDKVLSCDNPQDDGLTSSGANKYESSSSIAVAAVEKEFELALSNRAGNKIYTLGGRGSYYVLSEGAQFQVQYDGVLNARIPIQFSLATEGRDDRIHCRAGVKVNKTTSSGVESVIGSSVDEKAVVDLSTIDMDLSVDISGVSVQSGDTISVDIELYTLTTKSHDKVTVNIEAFTARYNIAISLGTDFYIKLKQIGFDISDVPTNDGESPVISMTSGQCGGYEFEIHDVVYNPSDDSWTLRCARVQDSVLGQWFPNSIFGIEPDDTFVLLNIALPEVYITANEQRLYDAALAERLYEERPLLEPEIDSKVMAESPQVLRAGMWFQVKDTDLGLTGADGGSFLILIDGVEVTDKPDSIRLFKVTLRNNKEDNVFVRMQRQIAQTSASMQSERRSQTKTSVSETPTKGGGGDGYIDTSDFVTLSTDQTITGEKRFESGFLVGPADGAVRISVVDGRLHVSSTVTSDGDFVAYGDDEGGAAGGGLDVERLWQELGDSGSEQIAKGHLTDALSGYALKSEIPSLSGYATQDYVNNRINDLIDGAPAAYDTLKEIAAALEDNEDSIGAILTTLGGKADKATTLAGYGITDAYTKTQIDEELAKYVTIAGNQDVTGVKTFVNGIKIGSISLSVVDGRLHVSSTVTSDGDFVAFGDEDGASGSGGLDVARLWQELEADDPSKVIDVSHIPSITKAKISDFPTKWAWADISGKPSTFAPSAHLHAISEVTGLQGELNSKWVWSELQVKAVKVNSAASADNADTLDGVHASGLLTALTSSATTNLSITVGGTPLSVANLYAKYADQLRTARKINGTEFLGTRDITTAKWGMARSMRIGDYYGSNGAAVSIDGSSTSGYVLPLPQSIKVKTLDVDGVTLSVVDGRLHISATATSAGDFVSYGDEAGSSGSGGLDISRLWEELAAADSSKVINISHIPSIPTSKITGLSDYATQAWVKQQGYLTSVSLATISDLHSSWDAVLKAAKPAWLATVSLSTISDLHSSWDALLKVAPTKYVTRWPTASEVGALTQTAADGRYLRLSGGTISGDITFSAGAIYLGTADGFDRTIVGYNETSGAMLFFDGTRTVVGSYGAHSTAATHIRSKTGHATIGAGNTASYTILDSGNIGSYALTKSNYASTLDSRYVNVSGDTMTGILKLGDSSRLDLVVGGTARTAVYDDGSYTIFGDQNYKACIRGSRIIFQNTTGSNGLVMEDDTFTFKGNSIWHSGNSNLSTIDWKAKSITASGTIYGDRFDGDYISNYNTDRTYWVGDATRGISSAKAGLLLYSYGSTRSVYIYTNGSERMVVNGSGNVGIGTTSPSYKFHVVGAAYISSTLTLGAGITGVSTITGDGFTLGTNSLIVYDSTSKANRITANWGNGIARLYAISNDGNTLKDIILGDTGSPGLYFDVSAGRWGIGTTAPAYTLDVRGEIRATSGITLSSTDDYGWYISTGTRISAGIDVARGVNVGSLLVSNAWADYTNVPANGIYCKGNMQVARIGVGSSPNSNYAICTNGDAYLYDTIYTGEIRAQGDIYCSSLSASRLYIPSPDGNQRYYIKFE